MSVLLLIILVVLSVGPLRRPFLRHARFTVPAAIFTPIGAVLGAILAGMVGAPPALVLLFAAVVGIGLGASAGEACKNYFDRVLGRVERPDDRRR